jgi:two-component system, OmpR family, sensor histidine kinase KdpD
MGEIRSNPDELLRAIKNEDSYHQRGHLKIFFGYAAGVGKTYAMLKAAHAAKRRGIDVVVGYVEPHPRPRTAALLKGLEILPNKQIPYHNIVLKEFDLDAVIKRKPQLVIVDELAFPANSSTIRYYLQCINYHCIDSIGSKRCKIS